MVGQKGFYYDMTRCIACRTCMVACKNKNDLQVGVTFRRVYSFEGGKYPQPWSYNISISCNHCADAPCVKNCPTAALTKRESDGLVVLDEERCIGCRYCMWSCPYGAIQFLEEEGRVAKCDGCADLVDQGQNPACVDACPMRALEFGEIADLRKRHGENARVRGLPDPNLTRPSITINPTAHARV